MAAKSKKIPAKAGKEVKETPKTDTLHVKKYMRPDEVAAYFDVARSTVYLWGEHGLLEICKVTNGTIRVTVDSVKKLEKEGFVRSLE